MPNRQRDPVIPLALSLSHTNADNLVRETLTLIWHYRTGVSQLLDTSRTVEYVLCSQGFELCISKRNRVGDITGFVPEPDAAEIRLRPAQLAKCGAINRLVHVSFGVNQNHMNIITGISQLNRSDELPAITLS